MPTYTTVQLAKKLGIGRSTIYRWMRDRKIRGGRFTRVGKDIHFQVRLWTDREIADVRKYMQENYGKGRGRKKKA